MCKGTGWIEVLGAGMVNPKVLEMCGIDSSRYTRLCVSAWAWSASRCCSYGIPNMRYAV